MVPPPNPASPMDVLEAPLEAGLEEAQRTMLRLNDQVQDFVRARPVTCILGAAAVGYVIGKIAARY